MSIFEGALTMFTSVLGAGVLGLPYAIYSMGLYYGLAFCFVFIANFHFSNKMYVKAAEMLPNKFASAFEISYMLFGKAGYLLTCFLFTSLTFGCLLLYYLIMAENIAAIFVKEEEKGEESFWYSMITNQNFCTFAFSLTQLPMIFKRSLKEMNFMS